MAHVNTSMSGSNNFARRFDFTRYRINKVNEDGAVWGVETS